MGGRRTGAVGGGGAAAAVAAVVGLALLAPAAVPGAAVAAGGTSAAATTARSTTARSTTARSTTGAPTAAAGAVGAVRTAGTTTRASWTLRDPFSREVVRPGDQDTDPWHIEHVRELQYRLSWRGLFHATPTGWFGPVTEAAVKAFQRRNGIAPTGVVGYRTWKPLIRRTVRGRDRVPAGCTRRGWRACYDRTLHQVSLYHSGTLLNSWLVRGGGSSTPTRTGSFTVYYRDIDHVSSVYDAPMPYAQFFSGGQALHGSRLMMDPFVGHSHGCVNLYVEDARQLWNLTATHTLRVRVYGAWD